MTHKIERFVIQSGDFILRYFTKTLITAIKIKSCIKIFQTPHLNYTCGNKSTAFLQINI